jgi:hypothetical protein
MWWANNAALGVWSADSLESLLARDFTDISAASERRLEGYLYKFNTTGEAPPSPGRFTPTEVGPNRAPSHGEVQQYTKQGIMDYRLYYTVHVISQLWCWPRRRPKSQPGEK